MDADLLATRFDQFPYGRRLGELGHATFQKEIELTEVTLSSSSSFPIILL